MLLAALVLLAPVATAVAESPKLPGDWTRELGSDTVLLLVPTRGRSSLLSDMAAAHAVTVSGGRLVDDPKLGQCIRFGNGRWNAVRVPDTGDASVFAGGVTFEAWLNLDEPKPGTARPKTALAEKNGSFLWTLTEEGKINNEWLGLPTEPVATDGWFQYRTYPVGNTLMNGEMELPTGRWVHVAITYDEKSRTLRTWIDGGLDRDRQFALDGPQPLRSRPGEPFVFLRGIRDCRLGGIRVRRGAHDPAPTAPMSLFVNQLPWEERTLVTLDRIRDGLSFPLEAVVIAQSASGATKTVSRASISRGPTAQIEVPMSGVGWAGSVSTLIVKVFEGNRQVFTEERPVVRPRRAGAVTIRPDRSISLGSRVVFPRLIYHVFPEDLPTVAEMGFNVFLGRDHLFRYMAPSGDTDADIAARRESLDRGSQAGLRMALPANFVHGNPRWVELLKGHPGLLCWYAFDEPWGRLGHLVTSYNATRLVDPEHPIVIVQNNPARFRETAEGCDVLGCDVYPIPRVSLRAVADITREAVKAVYGRKPVWTILPAYVAGLDRKLPSLEELRCMVYLALCEGANGIGIYAWDDRPRKREGHYLPRHPETVEVVSAVMREIRSLESILVSPNLAGAVSVSGGNPAVHAAVKEVAGKRYLFVANDSRREETGQLVLRSGGSYTARPLASAGGREPLEFRGGRAELRLPRLAALAFELTASPASGAAPGARHGSNP